VCCHAFSDGQLPERVRHYLIGTVIGEDATAGVLATKVREVESEGGLNLDEMRRFFELYQQFPLTDTPPGYVTAVAAGREPELPSDLSALLVVRENEPEA
jgi:hypothetical protein